MQKVLITGVSSGLGNALAKAYVDRGAMVYGIGRYEPRALEGELFHFLACDLSILDDIENRVSPWLQEIGNFDIVLLNAGMLGEIKEIHQSSLKEINQVMDLNVWANKVLLDLFITLPVAIKQIIGISSGAAVNASKGWGGYSLSKSALNMLLKLYAHEMPNSHLSALAPGVVETPMVGHIINDVDEERYPSARRLKNGPIQSPQEAAHRLIETFPKLLSYESGSFLDVRQM